MEHALRLANSEKHELRERGFVRIFAGYGYNDHDKWIEELVFPLIESFGCEVVHGKNMMGDNLSTKVRETVLSCDALLGFLTRREQSTEDKWTTHRWVVEELAAAFDQIPTIEIRESNVDPQGGMLGSQQRIDYDAAGRRKHRCSNLFPARGH